MPKRLVVLILLALVACLAWWLWHVGQRIEYPQSAKILLATGQVQRASWQPPSGKLFSLLLATPNPEYQLHPLSGTIRLYGPTGQPVNYPFRPADLVPANWLNRHNRSCVIIGKGPSSLDNTLATLASSGRTIEVELLLDHTPDFPLELWASWLTSPAIEHAAAQTRIPEDRPTR